MIQQITGNNKEQIKELYDNCINLILGTKAECLDTETEIELPAIEGDNTPRTQKVQISMIKWDVDELTQEEVYKLIVALCHRQDAGLLTGLKYPELREEFLQGSYHIICSDRIKSRSVLNDILLASGVRPEQIVEINIPMSKENLNIYKPVQLAVMLSPEQENCISKAIKTKQIGIKISKTLNAINTSGYSAVKIATNDILVPGAETVGKIGGVVAGGVVNAAYKGGVTGVNELVKTVNVQELRNYGPAQELKQGFRKLFKRDDGQNQFASGKGTAII